MTCVMATIDGGTTRTARNANANVRARGSTLQEGPRALCGLNQGSRDRRRIIPSASTFHRPRFWQPGSHPQCVHQTTRERTPDSPASWKRPSRATALPKPSMLRCSIWMPLVMRRTSPVSNITSRFDHTWPPRPISSLVCSPHSRSSPYVNEEIRRFAETHGTSVIIPILIAGIPNPLATKHGSPFRTHCASRWRCRSRSTISSRHSLFRNVVGAGRCAARH